MGLPSKNHLVQVQTNAPELDSDSIDDALTDDENLPERQIQFPGLESLSIPSTARVPSSGNLVSNCFVLPDRGIGFQWRSALKQSLLFLSLQHGRPDSGEDAKRITWPFLKDYFRSVKGLGAWADGGKFFTKYVAHPMEGSLVGYLRENDPGVITQQFGRSKAYWKSRMKAMGWTAAFSTQFELGLISQASIGNVGLHTDPSKKEKTQISICRFGHYAGTGLLVGEDMLKRYVIDWLERKVNNRFLTILSRCVLNPTRARS